MLEKPAIADETIRACLHDRYGLTATTIEFLPLGGDANTAVYRVMSAETVYFLRLRGGTFDAATVSVPKHLHDTGIPQVIAPVTTTDGAMWTPLDRFHAILYPFIDGADGFVHPLSAQNWVDFGKALRRVHTTPLPQEVTRSVPRETFAGDVRAQVRDFQAQVAATVYHDPIAAAFATFMHSRRDTIHALVQHAERLAAALRAEPRPFILCHADIHVGNLLVTPDDVTYLVDWDTLLLAPKERDLMFVGMGLGSTARVSLDQQIALFYEGYGPVDIDLTALAYYRCERIVQDIDEYSLQILPSEGDSADRENGLFHFRGQFDAGAVVDRALRTVAALTERG